MSVAGPENKSGGVRKGKGTKTKGGGSGVIERLEQQESDELTNHIAASVIRCQKMAFGKNKRKTRS